MMNVRVTMMVRMIRWEGRWYGDGDYDDKDKQDDGMMMMMMMMMMTMMTLLQILLSRLLLSILVITRKYTMTLTTIELMIPVLAI